MTEYIIRRNSVLETLRGSRRDLLHLWVQEGLDRKQLGEIWETAVSRNIAITKISKQKLGNRVKDHSHQGVVLEVGPYVYSDVHEMLDVAANRGEKPFLLLLDLLHGPQNIGSLLRTAEICGVHGVIIQDRRAPEITPAVVQFSAGAAEHLLIAQVTNLVSTMRELKDAGVWLAGLDMDADAKTLGDLDLDMPLGIVVGHEGEGLRRLVKDTCDFIMRLPMRGHVESLNAAIAGSVMMYQAWQARGFNGAA